MELTAFVINVKGNLAKKSFDTIVINDDLFTYIHNTYICFYYSKEVDRSILSVHVLKTVILVYFLKRQLLHKEYILYRGRLYKYASK